MDGGLSAYAYKERRQESAWARRRSLAAELVQGATEKELREAHAWATSDETLVNELRPLPTGRVAELIQILERLQGPDPDEE
jgi:hypothetical protein